MMKDKMTRTQAIEIPRWAPLDRSACNTALHLIDTRATCFTSALQGPGGFPPAEPCESWLSAELR